MSRDTAKEFATLPLPELLRALDTEVCKTYGAWEITTIRDLVNAALRAAVAVAPEQRIEELRAKVERLTRRDIDGEEWPLAGDGTVYIFPSDILEALIIHGEAVAPRRARWRDIHEDQRGRPVIEGQIEQRPMMVCGICGSKRCASVGGDLNCAGYDPVARAFAWQRFYETPQAGVVSAGPDYQGEFCKALTDFRDAGGTAERVYDAVMAAVAGQLLQLEAAYREWKIQRTEQETRHGQAAPAE